MSIQFPQISPIILPLGPLAVSWYSLSYVVGILLCLSYANWIVKKFDIGITPRHIDGNLNFLVIGMIIGARLGYVFVYNPSIYIASPIEILKVYQGGLSFHGGLVGICISCLLFARIHKISFLRLTDVITTTVPVTIFLVRIGNFINAELYGRETTMPWGVVFPGESFARHPSQLYESLGEGLLLGLIMWSLLRCKYILRVGFNSGLFLIFYGIIRMFCELFREPDSQIGLFYGIFTMGQLLCLPLIVIGIVLISVKKN